MSETLRANDTEKAIFKDTFAALSMVDEQYRRDSELSLAQRDFHEDRIATSQAELARLEKIAETRDRELTAQRRKIAAAAIRLYSAYPDISDDHARVFALAAQLNYGRGMEERELDTLKQGLTALDRAVAHHDPIVRSVNGQFDSLMVPDTKASGLVPEVEKDYPHDHETVGLFLPVERLVYFPHRSQFPAERTDTRHDVLVDFTSYEVDERRGRKHHTPALVASAYDLHYGIGKLSRDASDTHQVAYIIGEELIQESIANSGKKQSLYGSNPEFTYQAWLAGKVAGFELSCNLESIRQQIMNSTCELIDNCVKGYRNTDTEVINSPPARILLDAVRQLGAEELLFETFSTQLAARYHSHTIYRDPDAVRALFDAVIRMSNKSSH